MAMTASAKVSNLAVSVALARARISRAARNDSLIRISLLLVRSPTVAKPRFFRSGAEFRTWLEKNHDRQTELLVGFYKKSADKGWITYEEALDEALAFGWIDGVRRSVDDQRSTIRFTPRRPKSNWSLKNIRRVGELKRLGRMAPAGLAAFERRDRSEAGTYSFEQAKPKLGPDLERRFRRNRKAWRFWETQPPGYRKTATWWVVSAKREETRLRRLDALIEDSSKGRRLAQLTSPTRRRS
jgi:uncharacterized protein YdeI (YjbR/CyaY-like superfamily)